MTGEEVGMTLDALRGAIHSARIKGQSIDRVCIGYSLKEELVNHIFNQTGWERMPGSALYSIMGYPAEIDKANPWSLKVLTAIDVPVFRCRERGMNREKTI